MKPTSSRVTGVGARKRNNGYSERKVDPSEEFSFEPKQPNQGGIYPRGQNIERRLGVSRMFKDALPNAHD